MNILIIGAAGHVGSIVRPALEARYNCYYYDVRPVPGVTEVQHGGRGFVASIEDAAMLRHAMCGMDAVVNLAMGVRPGTVADVSDLNPVFDINVRGCYRVVATAARRGIRRIVNASSLSVYNNISYREPLDENTPTDAFYVYGMSKRLGEYICESAAQEYPQLGVVSLRLMHPVSAELFAQRRPGPHYDARGFETHGCQMGPVDTGRVFVAAIEYAANPGHHVFQATGEVEGKWYPYEKAHRLMGWKPEGA